MAKTKKVSVKRTLKKPIYDDFGRVMTPMGPIDNTAQILERIRASRDNLLPVPTIGPATQTPYMPQVMPNSYERYADLLDPDPTLGAGLPSLPFESISRTGPVERPYMPRPYEPIERPRTIPNRQYTLPEKGMSMQSQPNKRVPQPMPEYYDASYTPQSGSINDQSFAGFIKAMQPSNPITQTFGQRSPYDSFSGGVNYGVDYRTNPNTPINLPKGQYKIIDAFYGAKPDSGYLGNATNKGYGNSVLVQNLETGEKFRFSHLNKVGVKPGQIIQGGEIGITGSTGNVTGPHLDLEYYDKTGRMADIQRTPYASKMWQQSPSNNIMKTSMPTQQNKYAPANQQPKDKFGGNTGTYFDQLKQVENAISKKPQPSNKQIVLPKHNVQKQAVMNAISGGQKKITDLFSSLFGKKK